jgi:hypothetical protein
LTETAGPDEPAGTEVGSLAEEAAKLLGTLSGWARENGADVGHGLGDVAGHATAAAHEVNEHLATGAAECTVCPVCRTVHAVRGLSPDVRWHLTSAATSLAHAAAAFLSTQPPGPGEPAASRRGDVEHIDLDEE